MLPSNKAQLDHLKIRLASIPGNVTNAVTPVMKSSGDALVAEMRRLCPDESGALRDSIRLVPNAKGGFGVEAGGSAAPYAQHVEFGTSKMHAEPFFLPAYRLHREGIVADVRRAAVSAVKIEGKA